MLVAFWSPKGGSGCSVVTAACAVALARSVPLAAPVRLADLDGDQPAIFGLSRDPSPGLADWLAAGSSAPTEALDRFAVEVAPRLVLLPRGAPPAVMAPRPVADAGAALAVALRDGPSPTFVDCGKGDEPASRAVIEVADRAVLVLRACYLALRRCVHAPAIERCAGMVLIMEHGRTIKAGEIADALDLPVLACLDASADVARAVDAGTVGQRLPTPLGRAASQVVRELGLPEQGRTAA
jgi:hypothetical protein